MENSMERLGPPPPPTPEAPPASMPGGIPERVDPLTNLAIAASIRFGQEVLGLTDTQGPIDATMTRDQVYGQAEKQPVVDANPEMTPEFMKLRRGVMLEYLGVDRQTQSTYADVLDAFAFMEEDGVLKDPLEHVLIGNFTSKEVTHSDGTTEKVPKWAGIHHVPSALKVMQGDALNITEDRTKKDVRGRSKERGLQKLEFDLEGYTKDVSTTFPEGSTTEQVLGWLQDALHDPAKPEESINQKTGELRGYKKWHFDSSPEGMDVMLVYDREMRLTTAMPVDKPENQMKNLDLQESEK